MALIVITVSAQGIGFKGYNLGDPYVGEVFNKTMGVVSDITIGSIKGSLVLSVIADKRISAMFFIPTDRVQLTELKNMINGLENKFDIKLKPEKDGISDINYRQSERRSYTIFITTEHNRYMSPPYKIAVMLSDIKLGKIFDKEKRIKANNDF